MIKRDWIGKRKRRNPGCYLHRRFDNSCAVLSVHVRRCYIYDGARNGLVAQLVRAPPCHGGGRRFESDLGRLYGILAQLGEHLPYKQRVIGSSPIGPIKQVDFINNLCYDLFDRKPMWLIS